MSNFYDQLLDVLRADARLVANDGTVLRNAAYELGYKGDADLLRLLLSNPATKNRFFDQVDDLLIFDKQEFGWVIGNREFLPDSYTRFKNAIGLVDKSGTSLGSGSSVELVWPFKDCFLEGGQEAEDEKRDEIFYNQTLAPDEVDRLLSPKVFTGATRYSESGSEEVRAFNDNDNLFIRGNNLLALSSLLPRYRGRVQLIYIDPPFNTGSDEFLYNDRFNMSTWLTFMRNRLELAKELLCDSGTIFIHLDANCVHYAKVLADEIFGGANFRREIIWRIGWVSGYKSAIKNNFVRNHDTILFYSKGSAYKFNKTYIPYPEGYERNDGTVGSGYPIEDTWNASTFDVLDSIQIKSFSKEKKGVDGQKNEALLQRIIETATDPGDLVLDFFAGSATTCSVALKLGRQFIGVEQMPYAETIAKVRLEKVIEGEKIGISEAVGWTGGGSFVYCELAKLNEGLMERIESASTPKSLLALWNEISNSEFISYRVDLAQFDVSAFEALELAEQKRVLASCLDKNLLYINLCDIDDESYGVSALDREFSLSFYGESN